MNRELIQQELLKIQEAPYANKTDKQLWSFQDLSDLHKSIYKGKQPEQLRKYNNVCNRQCKLTIEQVRDIRLKYNPHVYGKKRLAKEYGVSASVIYRIINGKSWKEINQIS
ncbi:MAG: hypothetical protein J0I09_14400 [Sphingobacteriia bacterium]|nr:hypothetical protein [Sphingobacteriia bacterium]